MKYYDVFTHFFNWKIKIYILYLFAILDNSTVYIYMQLNYANIHKINKYGVDLKFFFSFKIQKLAIRRCRKKTEKKNNYYSFFLNH